MPQKKHWHDRQRANDKKVALALGGLLRQYDKVMGSPDIDVLDRAMLGIGRRSAEQIKGKYEAVLPGHMSLTLKERNSLP